MIVATSGFDPSQYLQRPALTLVNGVVYLGFGSHGDTGSYHGWLIGYSASTLQQTFVYNTTPDGSSGSIWQSGQGPAVDAAGNLYVSTANGTFNANSGGSSYGESVLKLNPANSGTPLVDWFTPSDFATLNTQDLDLGSVGPLLLPGTNLVVAGGKAGVLYLIDTTNMGHYSTTDRVVQELPPLGGLLYGSPVYWNGPGGQLVYVWSEHDFLKAFLFANGKFGTTPAFQSTMTDPETNCGDCLPGGMLSISANGSTPGTGILWAMVPLNGTTTSSTPPGILRAFDASNVSKELWDIQQDAARDAVGNVAKFTPPTIANGKVYLPTRSGYLDVYGLLSSSGATSTPTATATPAATGTSGGVLAQDTFQRANQAHWGTASDGQVWGADANTQAAFSIANSTGRVANSSGIFNAVLGPAVADSEVLFTGSLSSFSGANLGAVVRWQDTNDWYKAYIDGGHLVLQKRLKGTYTTLGSAPFAATGGTAYSLRLFVLGTTLSARVWPASGTEPTTWMVAATDSSLSSGVSGLRMQLQTTSSSATISAFQVTAT